MTKKQKAHEEKVGLAIGIIEELDCGFPSWQIVIKELKRYRELGTVEQIEKDLMSLERMCEA